MFGGKPYVFLMDICFKISVGVCFIKHHWCIITVVNLIFLKLLFLSAQRGAAASPPFAKKPLCFTGMYRNRLNGLHCAAQILIVDHLSVLPCSSISGMRYAVQMVLEMKTAILLKMH